MWHPHAAETAQDDKQMAPLLPGCSAALGAFRNEKVLEMCHRLDGHGGHSRRGERREDSLLYHKLLACWVTSLHTC